MTEHDLERFVAAQDREGFERVLEQLRSGRKTTHWMWFVFPQVAGLGASLNAQRFAIATLGEARAYLRHPVLGPRLIECSTIVARTEDSSAEDIFGGVDAVKLRSCMTLFMRAAPDEAIFRQVLDRFYGGVPDSATDQRL